jgi:hypothetical protein
MTPSRTERPKRLLRQAGTLAVAGLLFATGVLLAGATHVLSDAAATADTTFGACTVCSTQTVNPPPPPHTTTHTTPVTSTPPPPPDTTPPGPVAHLHANASGSGRILLTWANPNASDLAAITVRRGTTCPATRSRGTPIGAAGIRVRQLDVVRVGVRYCYAVFAVDAAGNASRSVIHGLNAGPATPVAHLAVTRAGGGARLTWSAPANAVSVIVRRGATCPAARKGTSIGRTRELSHRSDRSASAHSASCYAVFAVTAAQRISVARTVTLPAVPAVIPAAKRTGSTTAAPASSLLLWTVVSAAAVMLLLAAVAVTVLRARRQSAYALAQYDPKLALTGYSPTALVIPGLMIVAALVIAAVLFHP